MSIDPGTTVGPVHLTIADLGASIAFYERHLGLVVHARTPGVASLGAGGPDLLVLTESSAAPRVRATTGLYHFAILVPSRLELARALRRFIETGTVMQGYADHGVSEALYLADPDGNGIEVYRDRPRREWPRAGDRLEMGTDPMDFEGVLGELNDHPEPAGGLPVATMMGHVHLHVADIAAAERFYVDVIGFDLMQRFGRSASFVSAGGYHHHIAFNTWAGVGAPPPPPGAIGLRHFTVQVATAAARDAVEERLRAARLPFETGDDAALLVRDPSANRLSIAAA
jgi:catechol 2,3-dioxygenase